MKPIRYFAVVFAAAFPVFALSMTNGCGNKKESDAPTATTPPPPPPPPTSTAPAQVAPEEPDAGSDAAADADAAKPVGPGGGGAYTSIQKCCNALKQNANSAPLEQKGMYMMAAQSCEGLKNTPVANQAFAQLRMYLQGAKMPAACQ